ncbi:hypothetical protein ACP70R_028932 [Stipagrostis hirtigluma subsp. patula]
MHTRMVKQVEYYLRKSAISIIYACAYNYEHQYNLLLGLTAKMAEEPFRLLIVEIALLHVDFSGRGELAEHQVQ